NVGLRLAPPAPLRFRNRRDVLGEPAVAHDTVGRQPVLVEFPVGGRVLVGRIEDRRLEEVGLTHAGGGGILSWSICGSARCRPVEWPVFGPLRRSVVRSKRNAITFL